MGKSRRQKHTTPLEAALTSPGGATGPTGQSHLHYSYEHNGAWLQLSETTVDSLTSLLRATHVPTKLNVADIFTKAITEFQQFEAHRRALGLEDPGDS